MRFFLPSQASAAPGADRLSLLADIATRLLMDDSPEEIAGDIYAQLATHLDLDVLFNYLVDDGGETISLASSYGVPDDVASAIRHLSLGQAVCGTVALHGRPIIAERVQQSDDPLLDVVRGLGVRAYACHPLVARRGLLGTLAFGSRKRDSFTRDEIDLMATVATQAAVAIERARLLVDNREARAARQAAESSLARTVQESETRLRTVLDILPVGVFIADADGRLLLANRAADRIWGPRPLGSRAGEYRAYKAWWPATGRPLEGKEWGLPRAIHGDASLDREIDIEAFDGEHRTILNSAVPIRDASGAIVGAVAVDVDITERKRAEDALRRSEAILSQAGQMASLGAWEIDFTRSALDVNANPLRWSDEVYRIFGYQPREVEVTNELFFEHVHPDDRERVEKAVAGAIAEGRSYAIEHRIVRRDGVERVVHEHADIRYNDRGRPVRMTGAVQDVTEHKRAEEALRAADRHKNEFLAMLSHELRNPLAPIRYALDLLDGPARGARSRPREIIERQLQHLVHLVDDLLDVTRIASNKITLRPQRVDAGLVARHAIDAAEPEITRAGHVLILRLPPQPLWVDADPDRLAQVINNLLNNAARYTPPGGRVTLKVDASGEDDVCISVTDTGIGLRAEDLPRVFEMFEQVAEPGQGGLGIGLALVKRLVELHGGSVEAHSAGPGRGSEFQVRLPRAAETQAEPVATTEEALSTAACRVLVVDDNADAVEMMSTLLELHGHAVRVAYDGASALDVAREFRPQVGLFDIGLPGASGYELARAVRNEPDLRAMYLVAVTGWGQEEDRRAAREAGFDAHLTKPAAPETIERLIAEAGARAK